jgi:hypothetical protein
MSTEEESKTIDFEEDILLPFGKRVLAVLAVLMVPLVANQLEPLGTVAVIGAGIVVWSLVEAILWMRRCRSGATGLFLRAAVFTSIMALEVNEEASKVWLYGGGNDQPASPLTHTGFHTFIDGGIETSFVILLLLLAWFPLRKGHSWAVAALGMAGLPAAFTGGLAAAVALANQRAYGYAHPYAWLIALFWLLGTLCAVWGLLLKRRSVSPRAASSEG